MFLVFEGANRPPQELVAPAWTFGEEVMIEPYIAGQELAVAVMDGKALTVTEIVPRTGFYDYEAKYGEGGSTPRRAGPDSRRMSPRRRMRMAELRARRAGLPRALPEATFVMTTLTTFWSFWRSTPSPA